MVVFSLWKPYITSECDAIYALHLPYIYYTLTVFTTYLPYVYCIYYRPGPDPGLPRPGPHQAQPYVCRRHSLFFYFCLFFLLFGHFPRDLVFDMGPGPGYGARARPRLMSAGGNSYFLTFALFFLLLARSKKDKLK